MARRGAAGQARICGRFARRAARGRAPRRGSCGRRPLPRRPPPLRREEPAACPARRLRRASRPSRPPLRREEPAACSAAAGPAAPRSVGNASAAGGAVSAAAGDSLAAGPCAHSGCPARSHALIRGGRRLGGMRSGRGGRGGGARIPAALRPPAVPETARRRLRKAARLRPLIWSGRAPPAMAGKAAVLLAAVAAAAGARERAGPGGGARAPRSGACRGRSARISGAAPEIPLCGRPAHRRGARVARRHARF